MGGVRIACDVPAFSRTPRRMTSSLLPTAYCLLPYFPLRCERRPAAVSSPSVHLCSSTWRSAVRARWICRLALVLCVLPVLGVTMSVPREVRAGDYIVYVGTYTG